MDTPLFCGWMAECTRTLYRHRDDGSTGVFGNVQPAGVQQHVLEASVVDVNGSVILSSAPVSFSNPVRDRAAEPWLCTQAVTSARCGPQPKFCRKICVVLLQAVVRTAGPRLKTDAGRIWYSEPYP